MRIAIYGGVLLLVVPAVFAFLMTQAPRVRTASRPPARYQEVRIRSSGLALRGWLSPGESGKTAVVIVHGLGDTLESYQEHADPFIERGHRVLLLDLRGHGGSEGRTTTLGGLESEDVRAAIDFLKAEEGVVLVGHSMGAVAVLLAAADRKDVRVVVAEAPFDSYRGTIAHHAKLLFGLPSWVPLIPIAIRLAELRAGFDADAVDAVAAASGIEAPLLAIVDGDDRRMPEPVVRRVVDAHRGPKKLWVAEGVGHVGAVYHPDFQRVVLGFVEESLSR